MKLYGDGIHDDTLAIQEMLDGCGIVTIDRPGTYLISKTLIIHSNTRFILSPGAKLLAAPLSRCALIENEHFADNDGGRDENIEIMGGIWDGNCDEMDLDAVTELKNRLETPYRPYVFKGKLIRFAHVDRIMLTRMTVRNPVSYGVQIAAAYGFVVRDIFFDYNWHYGTTDGIHINGPSYDGVIENLCGTTNDDLVSLTTYDEPHAEVTLGDIENVVIRNISARNGYSAIRLLAGENYALRHIHIDGVYGTYRHHALVIGNHNDRPGDTWFDDITVENVRASRSYTPLGEGCCRIWEKNFDKNPIFFFETKAICGNMIFRNIYRREEQYSAGPLFKFVDSVKIDRLYLQNVHQTTPDGVELPPFWINEGEIKEIIAYDVDPR
ncbi:MAG: hypothetical protein IJX28_08020 [Clostridia bacterium]|nr:hypothetical protein [Clostridia bacterium]